MDTEIGEDELEAFLQDETGVGGLSVEELLMLQEDINTYRTQEHNLKADKYLDEILSRKDMGNIRHSIHSMFRYFSLLIMLALTDRRPIRYGFGQNARGHRNEPEQYAFPIFIIS
jgi:hypothetical protein